jgi:hypothetical protein
MDTNEAVEANETNETGEAGEASVPETAPGPAGAQAVPLTAEEGGARRERRLRGLWTVGSVLSIALNVFLCLALLVAGSQLFTIKKLVASDMLGGLFLNFVNMDQAHIRTTIQVQSEVPVKFDLPINQDTQVTTTQPAYVSGATVANLGTGGLVIRNAPADIILPAGTALQVHLEMTVPVDTQIPVTLEVPVDIPLDRTEMHPPLVGLQQVVAPYYWLLKPEWRTCQDVPLFARFGSLCKLFFWGPRTSP